MPDVHRLANRLGRQYRQAHGFDQIADMNQRERRVSPCRAGKHASLGHLEERQEAGVARTIDGARSKNGPLEFRRAADRGFGGQLAPSVRIHRCILIELATGMRGRAWPACRQTRDVNEPCADTPGRLRGRARPFNVHRVELFLIGRTNRPRTVDDDFRARARTGESARLEVGFNDSGADRNGFGVAWADNGTHVPAMPEKRIRNVPPNKPRGARDAKRSASHTLDKSCIDGRPQPRCPR